MRSQPFTKLACCDSAWTELLADRRQEVQVAQRRGGETDRDRLNRKKRQAKSQAGQAVVLLAHFASRGDESGRGTGDDQNFEAPEKGDATDLEQTGAYRHRFDGAPWARSIAVVIVSVI